jgi:hypothetical protein
VAAYLVHNVHGKILSKRRLGRVLLRALGESGEEGVESRAPR